MAGDQRPPALDWAEPFPPVSLEQWRDAVAASLEGRSPEELVTRTLEGLIVRPMKEYGFATCLRVSIGLHDENARVVEALKRLGVRRARVPV